MDDDVSRCRELSQAGGNLGGGLDDGGFRVRLEVVKDMVVDDEQVGGVALQVGAEHGGDLGVVPGFQGEGDAGEGAEAGDTGADEGEAGRVTAVLERLRAPVGGLRIMGDRFAGAQADF